MARRTADCASAPQDPRLSDDLIISCNRNLEKYAPYADQLVHDDEGDFPGPLAGIRAGLKAARHAHLLVLPCDVPRIDAALLHGMRETASQHPDKPLMLRHGEHWEPLLCIIPVALCAAFESAWNDGERSPGGSCANWAPWRCNAPKTILAWPTSIHRNC